MSSPLRAKILMSTRFESKRPGQDYKLVSEQDYKLVSEQDYKLVLEQGYTHAITSPL